MFEEAEFIKAIARAPDDDSVRMVYADWLDEHGDPNRAEFIRIQCGLAQRKVWKEPTEEPTAKRLKWLQDRQRGLLEKMRTFKEGEQPRIREFATTPELAAILAADPSRVDFRRGMIENLSIFTIPVTKLPPGLFVGGKLFLARTQFTEAAAQRIRTMPNLSRAAKINGLETAGFGWLAEEVRRLPAANAGAGTPLRP